MATQTLDRQLRYFVQIADAGSISRAADALDQTQSGLSKQLSLLESQLGQTLFTRTGRGLELTDAGSRLLDAIRPAYRAIDQALDDCHQQGQTHGTLKLAAVHTLSYYFTADVLAHFVGMHPHINLSLMGRSSPEVVALVESGKADMGLVYDAAVDSDGVESQALFDDQMAFIVREDRPLHGPQNLTGMELRLVGFPPHYALRRMIHSSRLAPTFVAEVDTIDAVLKLVSSGVGDCILPARIPERLLAEYSLRRLPITEPILRRRVVMITQAGRPKKSMVHDLMACTQQAAKALRATDLE